MYLRRKIDKWLYNWKMTPNKVPALIVGIRQCGKTKSIETFAQNNYENVIEINFWTDKDCANDFDGKLDVNTIISNLSIRFPTKEFVPYKTLIILDEIQDCPRARLAFKEFALDGRYDVIGSGSYLGINGYNIGNTTPAPSGYETIFNMKTLDFEEFLWALGYDDNKINDLYKYFIDRKEVPAPLHNTYKKLFLDYLCVGGFPKPIIMYLNNYNIMDAIKEVNNLVFDMKSDFGRRKGKDGEPVFKASEVSRIQNAFELIPTFLAKENKRFITSKISTGSSKEKVDAIEYLHQAHIVDKVYNLETPTLPLNGYAISNQFKLFPEDISIVTSMYGIETIRGIRNNNLSQGKGAIYESIVFESLNKAGFDVYYFAKESGLEIDFVIAYDGYAYLVEAKAKNGNTKSSKTVMANKDHYGFTKLLKIGDYNVGENNDILTIPHYMMFMLGKNREIL